MIALMPINHTSLTWHSLLYQTNLSLDHSLHQMTILRIERLSPIETQKHCISNSLKYNASLHFLYRHVDIITLLSCTLSGSDCIYQKRSQQLILALLTSYIIHLIYFAASQTSFPSLNTISCPPGIRPLSYLHRLPLRWTAPPKVSRQLLILYFFTQILFPSFIFYLLFDSINAIMYIE